VHAGNITLLQQNSPVVYWQYQLTQVDLIMAIKQLRVHV